MQADDVLTLLGALDGLGVRYWLDGGWGVDCLLGEQTRAHSDLDLVVHRSDVDSVTAHLRAQGYEVIRDWLPTSIAFRDRSGREVDLHPVDPRPDGGGDQVLPDDEGTWQYAPPVDGFIQGRSVPCAPAQDQVLMHTGYTPRAIDFEDVRRLAQRFEVVLPEPYSSRAEDLTRHHDEGEVIYVGAHPTDYTLRIVEPDPSWPSRYGEIAAEIAAALGDHALDLQHVGSTAVPGLPAKPIIDIDLTVPDPVDEAAYVPRLEGLGFVHWLTEPGWHQHRLLKRLDEPRVHLHVFGPGCPEVVRHRMFRDWLMAHPEDFDLYAAAKRLAASQLATTGDDHGALGYGMRYNRIKEPVVHEIYERMFRAAGLLD